MRIKRFLIVLSIIILPFTSAFAGGHYSGPDLSGQKITGGTIPISSGGTGATSVPSARTAFGLSTSDNVEFSRVTAPNGFVGNADSATKLKNAVNIGGVSFDGSTAITLPGVNANQTNALYTWAGNAATAGNPGNGGQGKQGGDGGAGNAGNAGGGGGGGGAHGNNNLFGGSTRINGQPGSAGQGSGGNGGGGGASNYNTNPAAGSGQSGSAGNAGNNGSTGSAGNTVRNANPGNPGGAATNGTAGANGNNGNDGNDGTGATDGGEGGAGGSGTSGSAGTPSTQNSVAVGPGVQYAVTIGSGAAAGSLTINWDPQ